MSRTIRNKSFHPVWYRRPKGWRQAKSKKVRHGALPPHPWDTKQISDEAVKCMERNGE